MVLIFNVSFGFVVRKFGWENICSEKMVSLFTSIWSWSSHLNFCDFNFLWFNLILKSVGLDYRFYHKTVTVNSEMKIFAMLFDKHIIGMNTF